MTGFMRAVAATGYDGTISLEIFNDQFRGGRPTGLAVDGYRSLVAIMDDVRRAEPDIVMQAPDLPPRIRVDGVEFIEFATQASDAEALGQVLRSMGFLRAGNHRTKQVALWQQGNIRIILNSETTRFAHSSFLMHGTTICDVGLRVSSASDTVARALALGAAPFLQAPGPGEMEIPAIRSVGGSVLHFFDEQSGLAEVWSVDFQPSGDAQPDGAGLYRVDHIAETMNYDEMLSWSLFYTAVFDMSRAPMVDVIHPDGLVRSQAIRSPDAAFRITLNGAETHRTLAAAFLSDNFGGAVHQVALKTRDIFATRQMESLVFSLCR